LESNHESSTVNLERELKRFVRQIRPGLIGATSNPNVNLAQLIEELKGSPKQVEELQRALRDFLTTRDFTTALTESGLTLESGAFSEIYKRLEYKILPKGLDSLDILGFISRIFDTQRDAAWLEKIDRELFGELIDLLLPSHEKLVEPLAAQVFMSLEILSLRLAGFGYDPVVTNRLKQRKELQHAFMDVPRHVHSLLEGKGEAAIPEIQDALERCAQAVRWIRSRRSVEGVSLSLTYRLMKIQQVVHRMQLVLELIQSMLVKWRRQPAMDLFFEIVLAEIQRFEIRRFFGQNIELLAFQITEHTGKAGEHYITRTKSEWGAMFRSAALGGVVIAATAVIKIILSKLGLPLGPEVLVYGTLYATAFLFIGYIGATMATKQPAMTASTIAASLDEATNSKQAIENLSEIIVRTIRSQMAALLGNYLVAFPVAAFIVLPFMMFQFPLMDHGKAWATIDSLNGIKGLSFWYACIAGLCLFVAGLLAGFADNWFVFNNVGQRLKQSEILRKMVGPANLDKTIHSIDHNLGFWVGNVSLGFFLAGAGALGVILGLPIDVRHITFSSATFGAAMASLKFNAPVGMAVWVAVSIFIMGLCNLGVSFSMSLFVAVKSRKIKFSQTPELLRLLGRRLRQRPLEFLFPLRDPP
jgi:site-specific recombinase